MNLSFTFFFEEKMKKYVASLLLSLTVIILLSCGKKEEARPVEEQKTETTGKQPVTAELAEQTPAPAADEESTRGYSDGSAVSKNEMPLAAQPAKPGTGRQQGGLHQNLVSYLRADTSAPADKKFIRTGDIKFRVNNVHKATELVEDLTAKFSGFVVNSDLKNEEVRTSENRYTKDSVVLIKQIVVKGEIRLRVPAEKLDSLVRELNNILVYLDYRILRREDVTLKFISLQKQKDRLQSYEKRQKHNIDTRGGNLENRTYAEEELLNKQMQQDEKEIEKMGLEDEVKYATLVLWIYQAPVVISEKIYDFDYIEDLRPSFWERSWESIAKGWFGIENALVGIITVWPIIILLLLGYYFYRVIRKKSKK